MYPNVSYVELFSACNCLIRKSVLNLLLNTSSKTVVPVHSLTFEHLNSLVRVMTGQVVKNRTMIRTLRCQLVSVCSSGSHPYVTSGQQYEKGKITNIFYGNFVLECLYMVQNVNQECNLQDIGASTSVLQWLMITILDNRLLYIIHNIAFVKRRLMKIS